MKKVSLIILFLATSFVLYSQTNDAIIQPPRLKVGVVLGGGGAKGAAHIGALKYIEEMGIPVDYVAGTSMGSIIGGLYAMGYTPDELQVLISNMNWSEYMGNKIDRPFMSKEARQRNSTCLVNVPFSLKSLFDKDSNTTFISQLPSAYVNNSSLINLFNDLCVGYQEQMDFNDLPIPFACVATDMITGKEVVMRQGCVPTAMRASMAIPGVFSPVAIDTAVLVDGGLVNNFPADVLRDMGADIIIGIEITSTKDITADDLASLPQIFGRVVTNSTSGKREENRAMCDVYIVPDVSGYGMLSFSPEAIDTLVARGYKKAGEFENQLQRVKMAVEASAGHSVGKELHAPHAMNIAVDSVMVRSVTINNVSDSQCRWLIRKGRLKAGRLYTQKSIEQAMQIYRGTGCFDEITYHVKEADSLHKIRILDGMYDLSVNMKPAKANVAGLGLRYDTEEGAAVLLKVGLNEKSFGGSKLDFSVKLSYNPKVNLTYTYSFPSVANISLAYDYRNDHFKVLFDNYRNVNLRYQQQKLSTYFSQFHLLNINTSVGASYTSTTFDMFSLDEGMDSTYFAVNRLLSPFVNLEYDNLDDAYFAKHGIKTRLTGRWHFDTKSHWSSYPEISLAFQSYITSRNGRFTIIPQTYARYLFGNPEYFNLFNMFGGEIEGRHFEQQMPFIGYASVEQTENQFHILRCDLRYNFYGKHYLTAMYNGLVSWYLGEPFSDVIKYAVQGAGVKYSYNSILGPISFTFHWSRRYSENHFWGYFSFGYTF